MTSHHHPDPRPADDAEARPRPPAPGHQHPGPHGEPSGDGPGGDGPDGPGSQHFEPQWWEEHYRAGGAPPAAEPGAQLVAEVSSMPPGSALDAGCGTGAAAWWLAGRGWQVTAVDVSPTAIGRARAAGSSPDLAERISWVVADVARWEAPGPFDLVVSQYVHPGIPFPEFVAVLARAVASGGTLLIVGHHIDDEHSAAHAPQNAAIGIDSVVGVLDAPEWTVQVAENRTRQVLRGAQESTMADVVVRARRNAAG